ncbi:hypothetical protein MLD38_035588 [Melastoma candidum]|uniref:Uncharacterized protein n=1 Tax=Melastoma candidum TaxID=119954 RepID=A0ACB9LGJ0_9MYRT|nr:hypothetical protein MLD38_035588 [Melastoma candidum]
MVRFDFLPFLLLLVFVLVLRCFAISTDVSYCDQKTDYDVKVKGVEISPTPVARGQPATFSISATTGDSISGGKLVIEVSYFGWHVHSETHDLCDETSCPVTEGDFVIAHSQVLPGSYSLKMTMYDDKQKELMCISFDFKIGFASAFSDS